MSFFYPLSKYNTEFFGTDPKRSLDLFESWGNNKNIVRYYKKKLAGHRDGNIPKFIRTGRVNWGFPNTVENSPPRELIEHECFFKNDKEKVWLTSQFQNNIKENLEKIKSWCKLNDLKIEFFF